MVMVPTQIVFALGCPLLTSVDWVCDQNGGKPHGQPTNVKVMKCFERTAPSVNRDLCVASGGILPESTHALINGEKTFY